MCQHAAVKFFGTDPGLAPEKIKHSAGPSRDELISEKPHHPWPDQRIDILPVNVAGFLLDYPEAAVSARRVDIVLLQGAHHVDFARKFRGAALDGGVAVDGHE